MKYIQPIKPSRAQGRLKDIYEDIQIVFPGPMPEPYLAHSLAVDFFDAFWQTTKETYFSGEFKRENKDVIAGAVSVANQCPYCVEAHAELVRFTDREATVAIQKKNPALISNTELRGLVEWGFSTLSPENGIIKCPPFQGSHRAEIIAMAVSFHYANRFINVFLEDSPLSVPNFPGLKSVLMALGKPIMKKIAHLQFADENNELIVSECSMPEDMKWAQTNRIVARAFLRLANAAHEAGEEALPEEVRHLVSKKIAAWRGEAMPLGKHWVETAIAPLGDAHKPLARLALMTALASYRVDQETIDAYKSVNPDDAGLVKTVIWASFQAARRTGSWL